MEHFLYALQDSYRAYRLQAYFDSIPYYILGWIIGVIVVAVIAGAAGRRWWLFLLIGIFASPLVSLVVLLIMCACGAGKITVTSSKPTTTLKNKEALISSLRKCKKGCTTRMFYHISVQKNLGVFVSVIPAVPFFKNDFQKTRLLGKEETYVPSFIRNCTNVEQRERDLSDVPSSTLKFNREED